LPHSSKWRASFSPLICNENFVRQRRRMPCIAAATVEILGKGGRANVALRAAAELPNI
jgi:hypothetical protein